MISDVLFEAVERLDQYLNDDVFDHIYAGELRERIVHLRNEMDRLRTELDTPPPTAPQAGKTPTQH